MKPQVDSIAVEKQALVQNSALIRVAFHIIGNSKRADVKVATTAQQDWFKVHKELLKSPELKAISREDFKMRVWLDNETIPFDMGVKVVSIKKLGNIIKVFKEYKEVTRPALVAEFVKAYPGLIKEAAEAQGPEFDINQYVPVEQVAAEFSFDYKIIGFEVPGKLKQISTEIYEEEVAKAAAQIKSVTHEIEQAQRTLLLSLIDTLDDKLSEDKIPTQKAIEKLQKFLAEFDINDVTGDSDTAKLVADLRALTQGVSAKSIKTTEGFQATLTSKILEAQKSLEEMVEVRPARRIKEMAEDE